MTPQRSCPESYPARHLPSTGGLGGRRQAAIDDRLLERAKQHASAQGTTLRAVVEEALRARLAPRPEERVRYRFAPPTVRGSSAPSIDVADRNALYDLLDDRR